MKQIERAVSASRGCAKIPLVFISLLQCWVSHKVQICFPDVCQREMLHCILTALQKIQLHPHISFLWIHQVQIPELLLKEGSKERDREKGLDVF